MMSGQTILCLFIALLYFLADLLQLEATSSALKRQTLIYHEPPFENNMERADQVTEHYITQRLDNFDRQNPRTFQMRYLKNSVHFKSGGPIFIFLGGEWQISAGHILQGQLIYDMAKESNGLLIYTEHRFYGKTRPLNTTSTESLKYLSVDQSLADLAHFVREITSDKKLNATGGVIVVGGSYSATMAAWFRQKYPHLVKGAWASSAPLQAKLNYFEYTEVVAKTIRKIGGDECYDDIENVFEAIEDLLENDDEETLKNLFRICDNFDSENQLDVWNFISSVKNIFSGIVQGYRPGVIEYYCRILAKDNANATSDIESHELYNFAQLFQRIFLSPFEPCISMNYEDDLKQLRKDNTSIAFSFRPWYYQTCSEFGWYQTTDSEKQPFGSKSPVEFYLRLCKDIFGDVFSDKSNFDRNIKHTNDLYGGFNPGVTHVYFTHGSLDPWHRMGILSDLNKHSPSVVIEGISHCRDLGSINYKSDSKQLINSKVNIMNLVKKWLKY